MITKLTKNLLKRTINSHNLNKKATYLTSSKIKKYFSEQLSSEKIEFQTRWKVKKLPDEEIKEYHDKIFEALNFKKLESEGKFEILDQTKRSSLGEMLNKLIFYGFPIPLLLFTLAALYTFLSEEEAKFSEEDYIKVLKIAKLTDFVNTSDHSNYEDLRRSLNILEGINKKFGYPDLKESGMYKDPEIKQQLLRLIMKDLPDTLTKDEKIDVLMSYDEALLKKFYFQDLGINVTRMSMFLTTVFFYSVYSMGKRRVKRIGLDFVKRELGVEFRSLFKMRTRIFKLDEIQFESLGNNEIKVGEDMTLKIDTGDKVRDEYLYEYLLLLNDQKSVV